VVTRPGTATAGAPAPVSSRVLTLPNLLSLLRLLGVPLFLYLVLVARADLWAFAVLVLSGFSDWLDGKLARAWGQISRVGQLLDPLADRLYIFATVLAFAVRDLIPWWLAIALFARDALLAAVLPVLRHYGYGPLPVHYLGKAATFNLLYAFPLMLLGTVDGVVAAVALPVGWAFALWGVALYWWAALLYLTQAVTLIRDARAEAVA
jgi:cardiolipin synthase